jgi:hypothetical protein
MTAALHQTHSDSAGALAARTLAAAPAFPRFRPARAHSRRARAPSCLAMPQRARTAVTCQRLAPARRSVQHIRCLLRHLGCMLPARRGPHHWRRLRLGAPVKRAGTRTRETMRGVVQSESPETRALRALGAAGSATQRAPLRAPATSPADVGCTAGPVGECWSVRSARAARPGPLGARRTRRRPTSRCRSVCCRLHCPEAWARWRSVASAVLDTQARAALVLHQVRYAPASRMSRWADECGALATEARLEGVPRAHASQTAERGRLVIHVQDAAPGHDQQHMNAQKEHACARMLHDEKQVRRSHRYPGHVIHRVGPRAGL